LEKPILIENRKCTSFTNRTGFIQALKLLQQCFNIKVIIITRYKSASFLRKQLNKDYFNIYVDENIHAKLFINKNFIILTSANLFYKSLYINYEFIEIKKNPFKNSIKALHHYLPGISL